MLSSLVEKKGRHRSCRRLQSVKKESSFPFFFDFAWFAVEL